ncbi:portal protein [Hyphomicrobium sp. DY-1]|uniref:portal protein n=1 Tax=Hyphomicrobium sp. DY-1 TaxID=3075650 RepID=UPI0039C16F5A
MPVSMEDERADCADAWNKASAYRQELAEIYRYYMPYRQSTSQQSPTTGGPSEGQSRTDHLYDATGMAGAFNFASQMVADWLPPFQNFFKLEAGPFVPEDQRADLNRQLAAVTELAHAVIRPRVPLVAHEVMADLFCGTGSMYTATGTDRQPMQAEAVPISEIALGSGPSNEIWDHFWKRKYKTRHLEAKWPDGKFSKTMMSRMKVRTDEVDIVQSMRYDPREDNWILRVYAECDKPDDVIWTETFRVNRFITPRFFVVPGESMGRGLAHLGLAFVRGASKARELSLRAAAFALMGVWMRRNDGVFNPDTAVFEPLAMWTVGSTGGPLGPSLSRLPIPSDFDISSIVQKDERDQINKVLLNDDLPELQDSVRSPTEIAARLRKAAKSKGGAAARISIELVTALVQATVDILEKKRLLASNVTIDNILTKATITSPAAASQRADKVQWATDWMQIILGTMGPAALPQLAKVDELLPDIGRWLGNDEKYIPTKAEMKDFKTLVAQMVAKMQVEQQQVKAPPPQPGSQFVNGSAF